VWSAGTITAAHRARAESPAKTTGAVTEFLDVALPQPQRQNGTRARTSGVGIAMSSVEVVIAAELAPELKLRTVLAAPGVNHWVAFKLPVQVIGQCFDLVAVCYRPLAVYTGGFVGFGDSLPRFVGLGHWVYLSLDPVVFVMCIGCVVVSAFA
jgi:hypothetical protein